MMTFFPSWMYPTFFCSYIASGGVGAALRQHFQRPL
jgi:hypothetical protein